MREIKSLNYYEVLLKLNRTVFIQRRQNHDQTGQRTEREFYEKQLETVIESVRKYLDGALEKNRNAFETYD